MELRKLYKIGGHTYKSLGLKFEVAKPTVCDVIKLRTWFHK